MKVVHFTSVHDRYDIRIFHKMCVSLSLEGYDVYLIVSDGLKDEVNKGVKIISVGENSTNRIVRMISGTFKTYRKASSIKADIYHFHDPELIFFGLYMSLKGKKVIFDSHEDIPKDILDKEYIPKIIRYAISLLFYQLERIFFRFFSAIVSATPTINEKFKGNVKKCVDINNYPILSELIEIPVSNHDKQNEICFVGNITQIRGVLEIIDALSYIQGIKLNLAGSFADNFYEEKVRSHPNWKMVNYYGQVDRQKVIEIMERSKIGLVTYYPLANHMEAQPTKIFEYMSAGLPILASNFPLWKELVEENTCGICVDPLNSHELADKIMILLSDELRLEEMGRRGIYLIKNRYNWDSEIKKLINLYNSILNSKI
jgi:glycosyltransferase involved in cell wall biosynthesis